MAGWEQMLSIAVSALAAGVSWVSLEFVARPYRRFIDLRGEIIRRVAETADVRPRYVPYRTPDGEDRFDQNDPPLLLEEIEKLQDAGTARYGRSGRDPRRTLRDLASQVGSGCVSGSAGPAGQLPPPENASLGFS